MLICALAAWLLCSMQLNEPDSRPTPTLRRLKTPLAGAEAICSKMRRVGVGRELGPSDSEACAFLKDGDVSTGSQTASKLHQITAARQAAFAILSISMRLCRVLHKASMRSRFLRLSWKVHAGGSGNYISCYSWC